MKARKSKQQGMAEVKLAVETLKNEGIEVSLSEISNLTGISIPVLYTYKQIYDLMGVKKRGPIGTRKPVAIKANPSENRYMTVIRGLFLDNRPMSRSDIADELVAALGGSVDSAAMIQAVNSLIASNTLSLDSNGYYRLKEAPAKTSIAPSVLLDETGNATVLKQGESPLEVAERLIRAGARRIVHLMPSEIFESTTTIISHRI